MVRSDERGAGAMEPRMVKVQGAVEIDAIQVQHRENSRIRPATHETLADFCAMKMAMEQARGKAAGPFIQIAKDDFVPGEMLAMKDFVAEEFARLMAALEERSTEMKIEQMQDAALGQEEISAQAAARFAPRDGNIVIAGVLNGKTREQSVSVSSAIVKPILAKLHVKAKRVSDIASLMILRALAFAGDHFLQRDDVRIEFTQDTNDAIGTNATV